MVDELTVGVHPTGHGFGFVVFESRSALIDWGHVNVRPVTNEKCLERAARIFAEYTPQTVVIEDETHPSSRRGTRSRQLLTYVGDFASGAGANVVRVPRVEMRKTFGSLRAASNHEIAVAIAAIYDELGPHLPKRRRIWNSEDERISLFLAASFVYTYWERQ